MIRYSALDYFPIIKAIDSNHLQIENPTISNMNISFFLKSEMLHTITLSGISQSSELKQDQTNTLILKIETNSQKFIQVSCTTDQNILNFTCSLKSL